MGTASGWPKPVGITAALILVVCVTYMIPGIMVVLFIPIGLIYIFWVVRGLNRHLISGALALVCSVVPLGLSGSMLFYMIRPPRRSEVAADHQLLTTDVDGVVSHATSEQLRLLEALPPPTSVFQGPDDLIVLIIAVAACVVSGLLLVRLREVRKPIRTGAA